MAPHSLISIVRNHPVAETAHTCRLSLWLGLQPAELWSHVDGLGADESTMSRKNSNEPMRFMDNNDTELSKSLSTAVSARLKSVAALLNVPVEVFMLPHSGAALPQVFASREEEATEVLRLYFAVDDIATRMRYLGILRSCLALRSRSR